MQVMRSTEDAGWVFHRRLNLMSIYVEFHTYMIHCSIQSLNLGGLCNAHGMELSRLVAGGVVYMGGKTPPCGKQ
jgi:hypothetical protein